MSQNISLKYKILPEIRLIIDCWFGELTFEKILASKLEEAEDAHWSPDFDNISDIRNAVFSLSNDHAKQIIEYARSNPRWSHKRKTAYLTKNPNQVVFQTMLGLNKPIDMPNELGLFSTLDTALYWLGINRSELERIQEILTRLKEDQPLIR